ncbi:MFS transporter [Paenibacillus wenxiniae]|uniref:MFS transporter n=1 Tax=Paenibacillus wenxiniae TaxID=1636843 RepID=A0ABW4RKJ4_9BACL
MATWFLVIVYLAFISLGLPDSLLGAAWPVMRQDLNASLGSAGLISMIIAAGTIVSSLCSGKLIEKIGTGNITLLSCLMTALALFGFSWSPSLLWLMILAIPLGLGGGAVDAALNHYVAAHYKAHHMNWLHCFWGIGATLGPIIMAHHLANQGAWRQGYTTVSMIQFGLVIVLLFSLPLWGKVAAARRRNNGALDNEPQQSTETDGITTSASTSIFKLYGVKPTLLAFLLYCGVETTVGLWGASYLVGMRGITAQTAAVWISLYYGGITLGRFLTGFLSLKLSNLLMIRFGQWTALVGGIIVLLPLPEGFALTGLILIGLGLAPIYPSLLHETPARFGQGNSARLMGYQMAVAYTGTTVLPPLFGVMAASLSVGLFPFVIAIFLLCMLGSTERVNRILASRNKEA